MIELVNNACTGCGACMSSCPNNCIDMIRDNEGFLYPRIDKNKCTQCKKCIFVCQQNRNRNVEKVTKKVFAGYNKDKYIRRESSSGGIFSAMAGFFLSNEGVVYGAVFDSSWTLRHCRIDSKSDLSLLRGSKYVQSIIGDTYKRVKRDLNDGLKVLFSGTPCQINGLLRFIGKEYPNLYTCGVICHGAPSPYVFERFLMYQQGRIGSKLKAINFRNKEIGGWGSYSIKYSYEGFSEFINRDDDIYFKGFLENLFLRKSCYSCGGKWKAQEADIVLGDFWGIHDQAIMIDAYDGVNAIIVNSDKGISVIDKIREECFLYEVDYRDVLEANPSLESPSKYNKNRESFFLSLYETKDIYSSIKDNLKWNPTNENKKIQLYPVVFEYLSHILDGDSLYASLKSLGKRKIALYANTDLMDCCFKDFNRMNDISVFVSDLDYINLAKKYKTAKVLKRDQLVSMYKAGMIDCIIVCSFSHENTIIDSFITEGIKSDDIFSIVELVFYRRYV